MTEPNASAAEHSPRPHENRPSPTPAPSSSSGGAQLRCAYPGDVLRLADGTEVTGQYQEFTSAQAQTIRDAAKQAGVSLLEK